MLSLDMWQLQSCCVKTLGHGGSWLRIHYPPATAPVHLNSYDRLQGVTVSILVTPSQDPLAHEVGMGGRNTQAS